MLFATQVVAQDYSGNVLPDTATMEVFQNKDNHFAFMGISFYQPIRKFKTVKGYTQKLSEEDLNSKEYSKYILTNIRTALAHGGVHFYHSDNIKVVNEDSLLTAFFMVLHMSLKRCN